MRAAPKQFVRTRHQSRRHRGPGRGFSGVVSCLHLTPTVRVCEAVKVPAQDVETRPVCNGRQSPAKACKSTREGITERIPNSGIGKDNRRVIVTVAALVVGAHHRGLVPVHAGGWEPLERRPGARETPYTRLYALVVGHPYPNPLWASGYALRPQLALAPSALDLGTPDPLEGGREEGAREGPPRRRKHA